MECAFAPVVFQLKPLGAREHKLKPSLECSAMQNRPTCTALCARINIEINVFRNAVGKWADGGCCTDSPEQTCRAASVVVEWIWIGRFWSLPFGSALWSSIQLWGSFRFACSGCHKWDKNSNERCKCAENSWRLIIIEDWEMFLISFPFPHL